MQKDAYLLDSLCGRQLWRMRVLLQVQLHSEFPIPSSIWPVQGQDNGELSMYY